MRLVGFADHWLQHIENGKVLWGWFSEIWYVLEIVGERARRTTSCTVVTISDDEQTVLQLEASSHRNFVSHLAFKLDVSAKIGNYHVWVDVPRASKFPLKRHSCYPEISPDSGKGYEEDGEYTVLPYGMS
jgi:hypothetical protein